MTASKTTAAASKLAAEATKTAAQLKTFKKHPPPKCALDALPAWSPLHFFGHLALSAVSPAGIGLF